MSLAYLNGEFMPLADAQVSVLDRGFLFGDGVYEVIPFYDGIGLGESEHLQRLQKSLTAIEIPAPLTRQQWLAIFQRLLAEQPQTHNTIYLQVTRGAAAQRSHTYPPVEIKPTVFAFSQAFTPRKWCEGVSAITLEDIRWQNCYIKSLNLLPNCIANESAHRQEAQEAILLRDNIVTEGTSSNVFVIKNGHVLTTPITPHILNGITRHLTLTILQQQNIPYSETDIPLTTLREADEIWITSSTREIAPVINLDKSPVADGKPGPIWQRVYADYQALVKP